ncbi:MAG: alkaline phosphatase [Epulopiscium sp. Nele67-Bin005]|nr:MAG: alkaline phosphatase [Epulopiscium sp. Nele67-Bin005]
MKLGKKASAAVLAASLLAGSVALITPKPTMAEEIAINESEVSVMAAATSTVTLPQSNEAPKYIFMFIGDGMAHSQVNAAQIYKGTIKDAAAVEIESLEFTKFPVVGNVYTQDATSFAPDSASTATSIASGVKTHSGVIGMYEDKVTPVTTIAELLQDEGYKIGVVSTVTLNHATPAAFYANVSSRNDYYDIGLQMADSGFDYFGGGALNNSTNSGQSEDIYDIMRANGYTISMDKDEILDFNSDSGKVYAINPVLVGGAMPYALDTTSESLELADFVQKGIDVLDNENGFFMAVESGKIDWAGHANDAMSNIADTIAFDEAIQVAIDFYNQHPEDTLILVTGDHETGGMTLGQATTGYDTAFDLLKHQTISYELFDDKVDQFAAEYPDAVFNDMLPMIEQYFGLVTADNAHNAKNDLLVLSDYEYRKLEESFYQSMLAKADRDNSIESQIAYGGYDPLTITLTHVLNNKAGVGWTSYAHTGLPVAIYALGNGQENFGGSYNNTDIFNRLATLCNVN